MNNAALPYAKTESAEPKNQLAATIACPVTSIRTVALEHASLAIVEPQPNCVHSELLETVVTSMMIAAQEYAYRDSAQLLRRCARTMAKVVV